MDLTVCSLRNVAIYIFYKIYYKGKWTVHCQVRLTSTFKYGAERGVSKTHKLPNIGLIFTMPQKNNKIKTPHLSPAANWVSACGTDQHPPTGYDALLCDF